jgi:hypothetical protein
MQRSAFPFTAALVAGLLLCAAADSRADNQTPSFTALSPASELPFRIEVRPVDTGAMSLPTLHSFASAEVDGKWILFGGRTNGLHGFQQTGSANFPASSQNRDVWVIDPASGQSWHRSLADPSAGLGASAYAALTIASTESLQKGNRLYMVGGYGELTPGGGTGTLSTLTAIDLPGMMAWAMGGSGSAAAYVRQTSNPALTVTGGALVELGGRMQLVFGQNFQGGYTPGKTGTYTQQVRSFDLNDDGVTLSATNFAATTPDASYRRRDLNVVPVMRPDGAGGFVKGAVALSGVFTPDNGAWTVPVEINAQGQPTMADPLAAGTFKQGFNGYESATVGLFSKATGTMHELLLGGISAQFVDPATGLVGTDPNLPFVSDLTAVSIDASGNYSQRHLGYYPTLLDQSGKPLLFGANAHFFANDALQSFENGVIDLDALSGVTTLGYVFGGIVSNSPNTQGVAGAITGASNLMFQVVLVPVPEPSTAVLALAGLGLFAWRRRVAGRG